MNPEIIRTVDQLLAAVGELDRGTVHALSDRLARQVRQDPGLVPLDVARRVLGGLRRKRFFAQMQRVGDALVQAGQEAPAVRRLYAQSLIDQGALTAAAAVLRELRDDPGEQAEVHGLLGRVFKQRYVEAVRCGQAGHGPARNADAIREAIRWYHGPFAASPAQNYWHGINAVACTARARRDGVDDDTVADPQAVARQVLARIRARGDDADAWELATALEACVALDDEDAALGRAVRYTGHPGTDAFELASTLRQLEEVWCLDGTRGMGKAILPLLRGALLQRETGAIEVTPRDVREAVREATDEPDRRRFLQQVFGADAYASYENYQLGAARARIVARIGREAGGRGEGTGFLVRGADLSDRFRDAPWLLLTNAHVVSTDAAHGARHTPPLHPDEAVVTFQALPLDEQNRVRSYRVTEVLAVSGPAELDYAVLRLDRPVEGIGDTDVCQAAKRLPVNNQRCRVYIIGHPGGGSLSYSMQDNLLLDYEVPRIHYRTPTEGGSSGSPIFNAQWQIIGLHHAGSREMPQLRGQGGTYEANEGIWIQSIREALA